MLIDAGIFSAEEMHFEPPLLSLLPPFLPGDWNHGRIARSEATEKPYFAETTKKDFQGIRNLWHKTKIEYLELELGEQLRSHVYEAKHPDLSSANPVIAKFATFPWEILFLKTKHQLMNGFRAMILFRSS